MNHAFKPCLGDSMAAMAAARRFMMACRHAGVMNGYEQVPKPVSMQEIPVGDVLRVKMAPGIHAGDLGEGCEALAAALAVREVRVGAAATRVPPRQTRRAAAETPARNRSARGGAT